MTDLLAAAKKALPGLRWTGDEIAIGANIDLVGIASVYHAKGMVCASFAGKHETFRNENAAFDWIRGELIYRLGVLKKAVGEGWVAADERLPELRHPVLAWDGENVFIAMLLTDVWLSFRPFRSLGVTHWMPLPQSPKET